MILLGKIFTLKLLLRNLSNHIKVFLKNCNIVMVSLWKCIIVSKVEACILFQSTLLCKKIFKLGEM